MGLSYLIPMMLSLALVPTAAGCLAFQQGPVNLWGSKHYVTVGNERLWVEESGPKEAPAVLLIHGYGASGQSWRKIRPTLAQRYRVVVVDMPGFGRSDKYPGDYSIKSIGRKLFKVLDARGIHRVHLVGHSFGTAVALGMGQLDPRRVRSLTLIASFAYEDQLPPFMIWARAPGMGEFLYAVIWDQRLDDRLTYAFYDPDRYAHPDGVDEARKNFDHPGAMAASLATVRAMRLEPLEQRYAKMKLPTLIISGRDDRVTRLPAARRLAADLPDARHVVIPRCGHIPIIEQPAKVLQALQPFLAQQVQPGCSCPGHARPLTKPSPAPTPTPAHAPTSAPASSRPAGEEVRP
jgi:pimeloyl-ACP methyl ester carboxylesterase